MANDEVCTNGDSPYGQSEIRVKLLSDVPAKEDKFGPHQRLATAIAHLVTTEDGGKCIGLEGGWGSGKSTVIQLLRRELDPEDGIDDSSTSSLVVIFDAWAHQGDPLRRTFLEKLIDRVVAKWLPGRSEHWGNKKQELGKQKTVANIHTDPNLDRWSKSFIVSVFLVPLGLALLSSALKEDVVIWWQASSINWKVTFEYLLGSLLTVGPLGVLLWSRVVPCFGKSPDMSRLWALFASKIVTDVRNETIQTPEPTSIEFEKTFGELMAEALCSSPVETSSDEPIPGTENKKRRVLLVLDNLDRVQPEDALTVWSTMQTFLQASEHERPPWFDRVWVLVPYDPDGIECLWDDQDYKNEEAKADAETDAEDDEAVVHDVQPTTVTSSFLDKSFQVRFEVPPPMISGWRGYLLDRLRDALSGCTDSDLHMVVNIYAMSRQADAPPTPRQLKLFVNQMGVVLRQWGSLFPLAQVAYYVMLRHCGRCVRVTDLVAKLQSGNIPEPRFRRLLGRDSQENLAAMVFNVEPKQAIELLLKDKLVDALEAADGEALAQLASVHTGFWDVLTSIQLCDWISGDVLKLASAAHCLHHSGLVRDERNAQAELLVRELSDAVTTVSSLTPLEEGTAEGAACLIRMVPDSTLAVKLLSLISKSVPANQEIGAFDSHPDIARTWVTSLLEILQTIDSMGVKDAWDKGVQVPGESKSFINACNALVALDPDGHYWPLLRTDSPVADIVTAMAQPPEGATTTDTAANLATVRVMKACSMQPPWESIAKTAVDTIVGAQSIAPDEIEDAFDTLWEMKGISDTGETALKQVANQGYALHHLHSVGPNAEADLKASLALAYLLYSDDRVTRPSTPPGAAAGFDELNTLIKQPEDSFADAISKRISRTSSLRTLFGVARNDGAVLPLAMKCVNLIAQADSDMAHVSPAFVMSEWDLLQSAMNQADLNSLLKLLVDRPGFLDGIMESTFGTQLASLYTMIVRILKKAPSFDSWCLKGLQSLDENQWYAEISGEGACLDLVIALTAKDPTPGLDGAYGSAMAQHARSIMSDGVSVQRLSKSWPVLIGYTRDESRKSLAVNIRNAAMDVDGQLSDQFLDIYGDELIGSRVLGENGDVLDRLLIPVAFTKPRVRRINWLTKLFEQNPGILAAYDSQQAADFRTTVRLQAKSATRKALRKHYQELYDTLDGKQS